MKTIPEIPNINTQAHKIKERPLRLVQWDELLNIPSPGWLVDGVIEQNSLSMLYGAPGTGKSFVALDLALSIAYGRPWNEREVAGGSVLYVAAEGYQSLARRLTAWANFYDLPPTNSISFVIEPVDLTGGLKILDQFMMDCVGTMPGAEMGYHYGDEGLMHSGDMSEAPPLRLVIFDTLARCTTGADENDAKDMGRVVQWLDYLRDTSVTKINPAVMVVHHSSKYNHLERGSTVVRGAADTMLYVKMDTDGPVIRCTKQKNDEPFKPIMMTIKPMGNQSALVIPRSKSMEAHLTPLKQNPAIAVFEKRVLNVLTIIGQTDEPQGMRLIDIAERAELPPATAYRARVTLTSAGLIHFNEDTKRSMITLAGLKHLIERGVFPASVLDGIAE